MKRDSSHKYDGRSPTDVDVNVDVDAEGESTLTSTAANQLDSSNALRLELLLT